MVGASLLRDGVKSAAGESSRIVFLDVETTGLQSCSGDRVAEIGLVEMIDRVITGRTLHFYVNPQRSIPDEAFRVHGLSRDFLAGKPVFAEVADELLQFVDGSEVAIHNAPFDAGFLNMELARCGRQSLEFRAMAILDTLTLSKKLSDARRHSLDALCDRYGIDRGDRQLHGALLDAQLLAKVYLAMTRSQESLWGATESEADNPIENLQSSGVRCGRPVQVSESELLAHLDYLTKLAAESKNVPLWTQLEGARV